MCHKRGTFELPCMTEGEFKTRFNNHIYSFNHKKHATSTALSRYIWDLKNKNENYSIEWSILKHARPYTSGGNSCNLCTTEKLLILNADKRFLLNKRSELVTKCRHAANFLCKWIFLSIDVNRIFYPFRFL